MSENWKYQLSLKIENHLINVRADTIEEFTQGIADLEAHKEPITLAIASYAPQKPERPAPAVAPGSRPVAPPGGAVGEIGPVSIVAITVSDVDKNGNRMDSSRYAVKFSDGKTYSTFSASVGESAQTLKSMGKQVYYTTVPGKNPKFTNLDTIRMAA